MITETVFIGRNNSFSLQLLRGGEPINLLAIRSYELYLNTGLVFNAEGSFLPKEDGIVEISIGHLLTEEDLGKVKGYLVTTDPVNVEGVRWPNFDLWIKE